MSFTVLKCPVCGAGGVQTRGEGKYYCPYCSAEFSDDAVEIALKKIAESIDSVVGSLVDEKLRADKEEKFYNLRSNLWERIHAKYLDSDAIVDICRDIKKIEPHDFLAEFFELANSAPAADVAEYINRIDVRENEIYIDLVIDFMISSLTSEYIAPTNYLIERAYRGKDLVKFERYITGLEEEAKKVDSGVYETMLPRDVFIAYSSKDMDKVLEIMRVLEENGMSCFVAMRNLQHGRDAVANYEKALREAIDNSKMLVFVSSKNSRNFQCDAFKKELSYIKQSELAAAPAEYRNSYSSLSAKYKKPRIEYRLDNEKTIAADGFMKEFFAGLDYCESAEKVVLRAAEIMMEGDLFAKEEAERLAREEAERKRREEESRKTMDPLAAMRAVMDAERAARAEAARIAKLYVVQKGILKSVVDCNMTVAEIPKGITIIDNNAFSGCKNLEKVILSDDVKIIGSNAFRDCTSLKSVTMGSGLKEIRDCAFMKCSSLTEIHITDIAAWCEVSIEVNAFAFTKKELYFNGEVITELVVPQGVKSIVQYAFYSSQSITSVIIPDSVESIGNHAFANCGNLTSIEIPYGVVTIGVGAFEDCNKLSSVAIPGSVETIGVKAFERCRGLRSITISEGVKKIESGVFKLCESLKTLNIPASVEYIGMHVFRGCHFKSLTVDSGNKKYAVRNNCLLENPDGKGFSRLFDAVYAEKIQIPDSVETIGRWAFNDFYAREIIIPESVNCIEENAFETCWWLSSATFENPKGWVDTGKKLFAKIPSSKLSNPSNAAEMLRKQRTRWERH